MKKLILILILIPNILYAKETFDSFAARTDSWAQGLNGYVVSSGKDVTIDLGKNANVVKGMEFITTKDGQELLHPVTGKSLGRKKVETGKIIINRVEEKYSICSIKENKGIGKGNQISHIYPVPVSIKTNLLEESETAQLRYALFKQGALVESDSSDYSIVCGREKQGANTAKCSLTYKGNEIFSDDIAVKGVKIITTAKNVDALKPYKIETSAYGMAIGYFTGKENGYLVAVNERSSVIVYEIKEDVLVEKTSINSIAENIVNIEAVDLNNNGKDELFISAVTKKNQPASYIFEYDNGEFKILQKDIPYFFRTYYVAGKKNIICQSYTEGAMTGMIYGVEYKKDENKYSFTTPYSRSYGAAIYGFGLIKGSENRDDEIMFFNRHGELSLSDGENIKIYKELDCGNTPNYLEYSEKLNTGVNVAATGDSAGFFVYDEQSIIVPVYQRIIQMPDGSIMLYSNKLVKMNVIGKYKAAKIGSYFFTDKMVPVWEKNLSGTAVAEIDVTSDGSHLAYIVSKNKNGLSKSYLYVIDSNI